MTSEQSFVVTAPKLQTFAARRLYDPCASCGIRISLWDRLTAYLKGNTPTIAAVKYCSGGKAPTENKGLMAAMMLGDSESFNPCAGIAEPHLHLTCRFCGYSSLMSTRTQIKGAA